MSYWKGAGSSIGEGMGLMVNAFVSRQDQLRQQAQQEELLRRQAEQQRLENERAATRLQMDQEEAARRAMNDETNRARLARADGVNEREGEFRTVLAPLMNNFQQGLDADLAKYAPTTKDGRPNPGYDRAMYEATLDRQKQARKLWSQVGLAVGQGQGWQEARTALTAFLGGDDSAPAAPQAAPPVIDMQFPAPAVSNSDTPAPPPAPMSQSKSAREASPPAAPQPQVTPPAAALPATVQEIPASQLTSLDDATIAQRYGQGGVEYARAARAEYITQQAAAQEKVRSSQVTFWGKAAQNVLEDKDRPATPEQLTAAATVMALINLPELSDEQAAQFGAAVKALTPRTLTAATWQNVLDTKDPAAILAALPMYQAQAPDVVRGFDPTAFQTQFSAAVDKDVAAAVADRAAAGKSAADATETAALLPGKLAQQGADLAGTEAETDLTVAQTTGERADTDKAQQDARVQAYDLGIKQVTNWAKSGATVYQLTSTNPQAWARMKADLGVNDAGLTALIQQARYEYGRKLDGEDLELKLKASQVATDGARRAGIYADTANTQARTATENATRPGRVAEIDTRVAKLNADIQVAQAQGRNVESMTRERDTLLGEREGLLVAQTGATNAGAALSWARIADVKADIQNDRTRTAAYVQTVRGNYAVDMAQVGQITANTALARAKNPNDPLYNPVIASSKPGDPVDALKKRAGVFYTQADQALRQAQTLQTQISSLTNQAKGVTGVVDVTRLSPADQAKLRGMTAQRDKLFGEAQAARQRGDDVITNGMDKLPASPVPPRSTVPVPKSFTPARDPIAASAKRLGVDPNALAAVISFETGGTFNPATKNPTSSATGLIQFMEQTARELGTTTAALRGMTVGQQMMYVEKYLRGRGIKPGASMEQIYQAVAGSGYKRGSEAYEKNRVWDSDGDGVIEPGEQTQNPAFQQHVRAYFPPAAPARPQATTTPVRAAFKPNRGLETGLLNALKTNDRHGFDQTWAALLKAGYTEAQLDRIVKAAKS